MSSYIIDYDLKKRIGLLKTDNLDAVRQQFSVEDENAKFLRRTRNFFIPTQKFAITPTGRFEIGLFTDLYKKILEIDSHSSIQVTSLAKAAINPQVNQKIESILKPNNIELRDYQEQVITKCMSKGRGIIVVATAGGKTLIMSTLISNLISAKSFKKIVVIVPTQLTKQTYDEFVKFSTGWTCTWWTGEHKPNIDCEVIIAGNKILQSEKQDIEWLFRADALIVDEVHGLRYGNSINKIIKKFNTCYRFGFTGTMPDNILDQWTVKGIIGPVIFEKNSHELREEKYISPVQVLVAQVTYSDPPIYTRSVSTTANYQKEIDYIISNDKRNKYITKIVNKLSNNTLILVDRLEHGERLYNILTINSNKKIFYIRGEVEYEDRDKIKDIMEETSDVICIAISSIFSTGINIKNLHNILFAASGKAKIRIIQSIGRGLRLHSSKQRLIIIDIFDDLKYGKKHFEKRKLIYEKEKIPYKSYKI